MSALQYKTMEFLTDEEMFDHMYIYWGMEANESIKFVQTKQVISISTPKDYTIYHDLLDVAPIINVPKCIAKFSYDFSVDRLRYWKEGKIPQTMIIEFCKVAEFLEEIDDLEIC